MKKIFCILLVLLMLTSMGGCQVFNEALIGAGLAEQPSDTSGFDEMQAARAEQEKKDVEAAEKAKAEAAALIPMEEVKEEEPEEKGAHKNTDAEISRIATPYGAKYFDGGYQTAVHKPFFLYAKTPTKADFTDAGPIEDFYALIPYNMFIDDMGDSPSQFLTNKELVAEYGALKTEEIAEKASIFAMYACSNFPREMQVETLEKQYLESGLPAEKARQYAEDRVAYYTNNKHFLDDSAGWYKSQIYKAADGKLRARIALYQVVREADDAYLQDINLSRDMLNVWTQIPAEVVISVDEQQNITDMVMLFLGDRQVCPDEVQKSLEKNCEPY
ncbi:MAG: hypothetical protein Q4E65_01615 [Clostridia bacterium]|nr:hypothetical protein [Clostridia bacterium]